MDTSSSLSPRRRPPWFRLVGARGIDIVLELIVPVVLVGIWWFASARSTSIYFPPLSDILDRFREVWLFDSFSSEAVPTLVDLAIGFVIAVLIAIVVGILVGSISLLAEAVSPLLELMRAIPVVALLPVGLLVFGIGPSFHIAIIAFGAVWPVLLNTIDGVQSIDPTVRDMTRTYRLTRGLRLTRVILPTAAPNIIAGMRIALSLSVTVVILSELVGSTEGIGYVIRRAQDQFAIADVWAGIVLLGIIGYVINVLFRGFEYLILRAIRPNIPRINR